jgi:hypothetical protein
MPEWFMTTRDRPLLTMVILCGLCHRWVLVGYLRPSGAIRGKWRILDGNDESVMDRKFGDPMVVVPACVD